MTVSLLSPETGSMLGAPTVPGLSDDEQGLVAGLAVKLTTQTIHTRLRFAYYDGLQRLANLGISVPPQLAGVRTVVDWPRICVDPLVQRAVPDGFRLAGATDVNDEFAEHWRANDMDAEMPLVLLDSLVAGRGYVIVGSPDEDGDSPLVTAESPDNLAMTWDPRTRRCTAAYQAYQVEGVYRAVLYLPDQTISMSRTQREAWKVDDRDQHNFGEVPVVRFPNRARTSDREGRSEITAAIMNTTDSACRSLLGMEIAREVYAIPRLAILGANESDFQDPSGAAKSAVDMAMTKILALERDEEGNTPDLQQLTAFNPAVFTQIIDEHAQLMASYTGFPPSYFGQTSSANPASADAIRVALEGVDRGGLRVQNQSNGPLRLVNRLIWRFANNGAEVPPEVAKGSIDWVDATTQTPAATTDAVAKQIAAGSVPATSDVTLKRLGYSAVDRERLAIDRAADPGAQILAELSHSVETKEARADLSVARDINPGAVKPPTPAGATHPDPLQAFIDRHAAPNANPAG